MPATSPPLPDFVAFWLEGQGYCLRLIEPRGLFRVNHRPAFAPGPDWVFTPAVWFDPPPTPAAWTALLPAMTRWWVSELTRLTADHETRLELLYRATEQDVDPVGN